MKHRRKLSYRVTQKAEEHRSEASGFCCLALCPQGSTVALARPCRAVLFSGFLVAQGVHVMVYLYSVECGGWLIVPAKPCLYSTA